MILESQVTVTATSIHELRVWCFVSGDVLVECSSHNASAEPFGVDRLLPAVRAVRCVLRPIPV